MIFFHLCPFHILLILKPLQTHSTNSIMAPYLYSCHERCVQRRIIFFQRGDPHLSLRKAYCILDRQVASSSLWILRPTQRYVTGCHVCLGVANDRPGTRSLRAGAGRDANSQSGGRRWVVTWWWHSMEYLFFCRQPSDEACKMYLSLSLAGLPC